MNIFVNTQNKPLNKLYSEKALYIHLFKASGVISYSQFKRIQTLFNGNFKSAYEAPEEQLRLALGHKQVLHFINKRKFVDPEKELIKLQEEDIHMLLQDDSFYPDLLGQIYDPPLSLYYRGTLPKKDFKTIAIVGSRKPSSYGLQCIEHLVSALEGLPICIISGLAYGIDAHAHMCAIRHHIQTCAILGSSIDQRHIYPSQHRTLAKDIISAEGSILSEFPPPTSPLKMHFPMRNRIIAGLSDIVMVVEAKQKSGALITADYATEDNRDVYAFPGSIFSSVSEGPNKLIASGAKPLINISDFVTEHFSAHQSQIVFTEKTFKTLDSDSRTVLSLFSEKPLSLGEIEQRSGFSSARLNAILTRLELENFLQSRPGGIYQKTT